MPCRTAHRAGRRANLVLGTTLLLASMLVPVSNASANAFQSVQDAYAASGPAQTIPPCKFSASELAQARSSVPNDGLQYNEELIVAIEQAQQERAGGACRAEHAAAQAATPVGTPAPPRAPRLGRGTPLPLGSPTAATDSGLPTPVAILAVLAGLFLLAAAVLAVARLTGWDPAWLTRSRHAWGEARYRASGSSSDVADRLRNRLENGRWTKASGARKSRTR